MLKKTYFILISFCLIQFYVVGQDCNSTFVFTPVQKNNTIEWTKFPEFTFPFKIVYEGPRFNDENSSPLKHGFSHLAKFSGAEFNTLPVGNRATTWYHIVTEVQPSQPWADKEIKSPWDNDRELYKQTWNNQINTLANTFANSFGRGVPNFSLIGLDIESVFDTDREILNTKNSSKIAQKYKSYTDIQYVEQYKREIQKLYASPLLHLKSKSLPSITKIGSYSDVLVRGSFNNWLGLKVFSWKDWTTDTTPLLHVMKDTLTNQVGGVFYNNLDFLTPSCYYFYNYEDPLGKDYLAYILFVIEANRYWSNKDIIPYIWLRYHNAFNPSTPFVPKFVAEATAIMPFFSGAKGLWLWDGPVENDAYNYATYEYFIGGLYRLSKFKQFFEGNYELVIPQPAIENAKSQTPIWRGVVKESEILIAAQNPYATTDNQTTTITVKYQNWQKEITLTGREVFLCSFKDILISAVNTTLPEFAIKVFPNPTSEIVNINFELPLEKKSQIDIIDLYGRTLKSEILEKGTLNTSILISDVNAGMYFLKIISENQIFSQKFLILK